MKKIGLLLAACCSVLSCAATETPTTLKALLEQIEQIRQDAGVAAVGLAIVKNGETQHTGSLGVADWEAKNPVDENTLYRLGSITKSFTGLTALRLNQKQPEFFRRPVNDAVPDLLEGSGANTTKLRHLLEHTAGLHDLSGDEFDFQGEKVTYEEAIKISPATRQIQWPIAQHSSYSNAGFGYAGYFMEKLSGTPFEKLVREQVLKPLDMTDSGFFMTKTSRPLAKGYNRDGKTPIPYWHMVYRSFGGLNSTPNDMAKFLHAMVASDDKKGSQTVLTNKLRAEFENPTTTLAARSGLNYGYGLGNYHWFKQGRKFHGHGGDADGYLSHYGYHTESQSGYFVVITAFNHKPLKKIRGVLEDFVINGTNELNKETATVEPAQLKQWLGTYVPVTQRFGSRRLGNSGASSLEVRIDKGVLTTSIDGTTHQLIPVSANHFRRPWQPQATYAFVTDEAGNAYLQGDIGNFKKQGTRRR